MGYAKHGFILAMYALLRASEFEEANEAYDWSIEQAIVLLGDADTNACIVGGVMGAYVGVDNIDESKLQILLECKVEPRDTTSSERPRFILPSEGCINEMVELVRISPEQLTNVTEYVD